MNKLIEQYNKSKKNRLDSRTKSLPLAFKPKLSKKDYKRGLLVELLDSGGYRIKYWYGDDVKVYPVEVEVDGNSIKKDAKVIDILFHPELEKWNHT